MKDGVLMIIHIYAKVSKDIFRNEKSHNTLTDYIKNNPYNWCKDTLNQ